MRTAMMSALGVMLFFSGPARSGDGPKAWIQVRKPMDTDPAGVLARSTMSGALVQAGYRIEDPAQAPKTRAGRPRLPDLKLNIELLKQFGAEDQALFVLRMEAHAADGHVLAATVVHSAPFAKTSWPQAAEALGPVLETARGEILTQLAAYRKLTARRGRRFDLTFKNLPPESGMKIHTLLNKRCSRVKLLTLTATSGHFMATCRADPEDFLPALVQDLQARFAGARIDSEHLGGGVGMFVFHER